MVGYQKEVNCIDSFPIIDTSFVPFAWYNELCEDQGNGEGISSGEKGIV